MQRVLFIFTMLLPWGHSSAAAQDFAFMQSKTVVTCPLEPEVTNAPDFSAPSCKALKEGPARLYDGATWIRGDIEVPEHLLSNPAPLGLVVMARGAREIFVNGHRVGQDGTPSSSADGERAGPMDSITYLPRSVIHSGTNEVILRFSANLGLFHLHAPVQLIGIGTYQSPSDFLLRHYWPSIATFGVLVAAFLYFGTIAIRHRTLSGSATLALLAFFAAAQLSFEVWRGLFPYTYPMHDVRMVLLVLSSFGFGTCLWMHLVFRFFNHRRAIAMGAVVITTAFMVVLIPGFDFKTIAAVFLPTIAGAVAMLWQGIRKDRHALTYGVALMVFAAVIGFSVGNFLDRYFFFAVSALLIFFIVQQALAMRRLEDERRLMERRARQLEQALIQARHDQRGMTIHVRSAGKVEVVAVDELSHCSGAGDYVELCLHDGSSLLHQSTLNELEEDLPAEFVRVHRSHIVNSSRVKSLSRESSGVGRLVMTSGATVPVSRRIMPRVRDALVDAGAGVH